MRLFYALFRRRHMPNGNIYTGKHRIWKQPTIKDVLKLKIELEEEEKNMHYLRHPYLTLEQSSGHARALGKNEANYIKTKTKQKPFYEKVTIESRLAHLRVKEGWD
ncbi:ribosomal protein 63, mitochondrial [Diabrotica virgifera virgifera]|uniref:Ribosomal protein 63, mitochondrial-like n=1 Tax=Diabrotica virgifera virgifera TaxID=50390 RepID=A0A6P7GFQ4_DIAVI|nr:ribosomal protein 63, mitochondrial [Diabrotica virgifera virgifera]